MINASANWWGGYRDPTNVTGELSVSNGTINDRIDYNPWLNSSDADASEVGFQADLSELSIRKQTNNTTELAEALELIEDDGEITVFNSAVNNNDDSDNYDAVTITKEVTLIAENNQGPILSGLTLDENLDLEGTFTVQALSINNGAILDVENLSIPLSIASEFAERGIVGPVTTLPMQVGSGVGVQALGVSIPAGPEALGVVSIFRNAGVRAIENNNYQSIQVVWDISVANNSFATRNVTFQWPSDYDNSVEVTDAVVWKNPDDADIWEIADINQDPVNAVQEGSNIRSVSVNVNSFSQFTVSDVNQPLPVELTRFSASLLEPHVELNWETASEINSDFFSVERSQNGIDFSEIGQIKAAGDSDAPLQYRYIDEQAANRLSGSVFYRLRTVDFDGSFEYSDITIVTLSDDDIPMIAAFAREGHPNLKLFTRAIEPGDYTVWITDLNGRKIFEQDLQLLPKESYELGVGHLPQSVYLIRCEGRQLALSTKFRVEEIE